MVVYDTDPARQTCYVLLICPPRLLMNFEMIDCIMYSLSLDTVESNRLQTSSDRTDVVIAVWELLWGETECVNSTHELGKKSCSLIGGASCICQVLSLSLFGSVQVHHFLNLIIFRSILVWVCAWLPFGCCLFLWGQLISTHWVLFYCTNLIHFEI